MKTKNEKDSVKQLNNLLSIFSVAELMQRLKVCEATIIRWSRGKNKPYTLHKEKIAKLHDKYFNQGVS